MQQGRRKQVSISLSGGYQADHSGKLTLKPKDQTPWQPPPPEFDTELDRPKPFQSQSLLEMQAYLAGDAKATPPNETKARHIVRERRLQMRLEGDPLGLTTGQYAKRPKISPDQPTPERGKRGKEVGEVLDRRALKSDAGEELNAHVTEITPAVRALKQRQTLSDEEYQAAMRFLQDVHGARFQAAITVRYQERVDGGGSALYESDYVIARRQSLRKAIRSVHPLFSPALAWLVKSMGDPEPLSKLGAYYAPNRSLATQSARGAGVLCFALVELCNYYGINHPLSGASKASHLKTILELINE